MIDIQNKAQVGLCPSVMKFKINADPIFLGCEHQDIYHKALGTKHMAVIRCTPTEMPVTWTDDDAHSVTELREASAGRGAEEASKNAGHEQHSDRPENPFTD